MSIINFLGIIQERVKEIMVLNHNTRKTKLSPIFNNLCFCFVDIYPALHATER